MRELKRVCLRAAPLILLPPLKHHRLVNMLHRGKLHSSGKFRRAARRTKNGALLAPPVLFAKQCVPSTRLPPRAGPHSQNSHISLTELIESFIVLVDNEA